MSTNENTVPPMPFEGRRFFEAVQMFDDETSLKYLRALWFYWSHTHCEGLPDDDEGLRRLCQCDLGKWARLKGLIFDNDHFFKLENGKWHQHRCREVHANHVRAMLSRQAQTLPARIAAGNVSSNVTGDLTSPVVIVFHEKALARVEKRIETLRGQRPFAKGDKRASELEEMKSERKRLMDILGLKA
jgi:hypothetical protein